LTGLSAFGLYLTFAQLAAAETRHWRIDAVNGAPALGQAGLRLSDDRALSGSTGCNNFTGTAFFADGFLLVDEPLATTRMACPREDVTTQEDTVLRILKGTVDVAFNPVTGAMTLSQGSDNMTLSPGAFENKAPQTAPEPALFTAGYVNVFGLSGPLNIRSEPTTEAKVVTRVLAGTLLRNDGCESRPDRDWCRIEFIDASGREGWAAAEYLQPAPALVRAKEGVFDRIGTVSCTLAETDAAEQCDFGLARDGSHSAALVIYKTDGAAPLFGFVDGGFSSATEKGKAIAGISETVSDGIIRLSFAGGRYDVPLAMIVGDPE
jgi:heat shock protein HslJ